MKTIDEAIQALEDLLSKAECGCKDEMQAALVYLMQFRAVKPLVDDIAAKMKEE